MKKKKDTVSKEYIVYIYQIGDLDPITVSFGTAFESWVFRKLIARNIYGLKTTVAHRKALFRKVA